MTTLTETHRDIQALAREFAANEIAPNAARWNEDHHIPVDVIRRMGEVGFLGIIVPEQYGGAGLDAVALALVMEEIAAADAGISVSIAVQNGLVAAPILRAGTEDQKSAWLPRIASGESLGCYALTEPDAGSDTAALRTRAVAAGDGYDITGAKQWISNGGLAEVFVIFARTGGEGARGVSAFIAQAGDGLSAGPPERKLGLHTSSTVSLSFDGFHVPASGMLGAEGEGLKLALATLDGGRITVAAQAVGIARASLDLAVSYASERNAFGGPIARFQGVQFPIADIAAQIDAARLLTHKSAWLNDHGMKNTHLASMAKLFASEAAERVCSDAIQIHGGYGYVNDFPVERIYRDVRVCQIYEGTSDIQRILIGRALAA